MKLNASTIAELAERLENCELRALDTHKITDDHPDMGWDDAYAIQNAIKNRKLARGERVIGLKAGLTSWAKMQQMGISTPIFGFLSESFALADGSACAISELIHPKVEPEIVFVTKAALRGPGCHVADVLAATDFVMAGIEVIDSRYRDFQFDLKSVIADNCSSSRFVLGSVARNVEDLDLHTLGVVMEKNGRTVGLGAGAAVLGHPANAVAMLANHLGRWGEEIPAGSMILSGGVTEAISVAAGDAIHLRMQGLGSTSLRFI